MLENFHLAAIITKGAQMRMLQIPLHQALQEYLAESRQTQLQEYLAESRKNQYDTFVEDIREIDFNIGYKLDEGECFRLSDYELPAWIAEENSETIRNFDAIGTNETLIDSIKGMVAFALNDQGEELMLFQNFTHSQVIRPGLSLLMHNQTYKTIEHPGLTLDRKLSAVYLPTEGKLLFRSFRTVNTFLPLADFYKEASEQEIREVLGHELLAPQDADALAEGANQWFRKRFAMLRDSGVLDEYSAIQIEERSNGYDVEIGISQDKIVFPADKPAAKKLLQFLNEEIFRGPITETLYETNSKRQAD